MINGDADSVFTFYSFENEIENNECQNVLNQIEENSVLCLHNTMSSRQDITA